MIEFTKKIFTLLLGGLGSVFGLIIIIIIPVLILFGIVWFLGKLFDWLIWGFWIAFLIEIFVFVPMLIFKKIRTVACSCIIFISYILGIILWGISALLTYDFWGMLGLFIGLAVFGVGVLPAALLGAIILKEWYALFWLLFVLFFALASRLLGFYIIEKETNNSEEISYDF